MTKTESTLLIIGGVLITVTIMAFAIKPFRNLITTGSFQKKDVTKATGGTDEVKDKTIKE